MKQNQTHKSDTGFPAKNKTKQMIAITVRGRQISSTSSIMHLLTTQNWPECKFEA